MILNDGKGLIGHKIVAVRPMTQAEIKQEAWYGGRYAMVLVLDDDTKLYPSQDDEGNGPGVIFGYDNKGNFALIPKI